MKISFKHLTRYIGLKLHIDNLSEKLFQLGHEHEIDDEIFDIEFTPNRGDCLSLKGLSRDLNLFYETNPVKQIYSNEIKPYRLNFVNNAKESCPFISFLKIEIDTPPTNYKKELKHYFSELDVKKNNFFTDVSNYISYETGQPTHCYDASLLNDYIMLDFHNGSYKFETLLEKTVELSDKNLVFYNDKHEIINLAGIVGGMNTSCNKNTTSVIVECAYFNPEYITGKSVKYNINSDAAYKFERNTDFKCHDYTLKRFLKIIEDHANIKNVELFEGNSSLPDKRKCYFDIKKINRILGINLKEKDVANYLTRLNFVIKDNEIHIPSHRNDIQTINDIAEEVARAIGYDHIESAYFKIPIKNELNNQNSESMIRNLLIDNGFYEVINDPFVSSKDNKSVSIDNPLDSSRKYLRTELKQSLIKNLLFNERRQHDSIKLFEIADVFSSDFYSGKRVLGIIASGRVDNNYIDFTKKIDNNYMLNILSKHIIYPNVECINIPRQSLDSKSTLPISYTEIELNSDFKIEYSNKVDTQLNLNNYTYRQISDFPCSKRDLSFSLKDHSEIHLLEQYILNFKDDLLKDIFIFDYYNNEKKHEIKIGFRFIFQSQDSTVTDKEVDNVINNIIDGALKYNSVHIPGLK